MTSRMLGRWCLSVMLTAAQALPAPAGFDKRIPKQDEALHALNRLTFGPRPGDLEAVNRIGVKKWIDLQLHPSKIAENPILQERLKPLASLTMTQEEMLRAYPPRQLLKALAKKQAAVQTDDPRAEKPDREALLRILPAAQWQTLRKGTPEERSALLASLPKEKLEELAGALPPGAARGLLAYMPADIRRSAVERLAPQQVLVQDLYEQKLYRAIYGNRQLEEVLTDFWFNHFNVFLDKGADRFLVTSYERDAIRPHVLGKFKDLLLATAEHPAMLFYLDNWQSVSPDAPQGRGRRSRGLNENYGRELLELHTIGVDGGYTQKDVVEVARCFTGWTIRQPLRDPVFTFNARVHDNGEKTVLGVKIAAGGGKEDALKVIDIVSRHLSTARFISTKLAQRFVADTPPASLINAMAAKFQKTDGDLREVMLTMLHSKEFWSQSAHRSKVKSPLEMVVSSLRATGADITFAFGLAQRVGELGQPLYRKQEPTGYSNISSDWISSSALLGRMNFAIDLLQNKMAGVKVDSGRLQDDPYAAARSLTFTDLSPQTTAAIDRGIADKKDPAFLAGLILGSPEFQRR